MSSLHVKKGDNVLILAGKDKGLTGRIVQVNPGNGRVVVENRNMITRHKKARSAKETSGIEKVNGSIDASNVQIVCPDCGKATRVAIVFKEEKEGKKVKVRTCKKCGASLDQKVKAEKPEKKTVKKSVKKDDAADKPAEKKAVEKKPAAKKPAKKAEAKPEKTEGNEA